MICSGYPLFITSEELLQSQILYLEGMLMTDSNDPNVT